MLKTLYIFNNSALEGVGVKKKKINTRLYFDNIFEESKAIQQNGNGTLFLSGSLVEIRYPLLHKDFQLTWWPASL